MTDGEVENSQPLPVLPLVVQSTKNSESRKGSKGSSHSKCTSDNGSPTRRLVMIRSEAELSFDSDGMPHFGKIGSRRSAGSSGTVRTLRTIAQKSVWGGDMEKDRENEEAMMAIMPGMSAKFRRHSTYFTSGLQEPPEGADKKDILKWKVRKMLASQRFDWFMGTIIVVNSITIGVQMTYEVEGRDTSIFTILEHIFLVTYVSELGLRFFAVGRYCLKSNWVNFDICLVGLGVASTWILEPILTHVVVNDGGNKNEILAPVLVLRVLRLLRLARSVRLLVQFKTLWMLVRGLLTSASTMFYTFMLMVLILYVFACLAMELITKNESLSNDESLGSLVHEKFSSISVIMLTLVQFVTLDDASQVYAPFTRHSPFILGAYFMIFIVVVSISLMNLVTAVIVEGAIEQGKQDREVAKAYENQKVAALIPTIRRLFDELDVDGSGDLSLDELTDPNEEVKAELEKIMPVDDNLSTFLEVIDQNATGLINIDEFCSAITKTITSEEPVEFIRLKQQLQLGRRETQTNGKKLDDIAECMGQLTTSVTSIQNELGESSNGSKGSKSALQDMMRQHGEVLRSIAEQQKKTKDDHSRRILQVEKSTKRMEATLEQLAAHILSRAPLPILSSDESGTDDEAPSGQF